MKIKTLLLAFACCAFLFSACSDDDDPVVNNDSETQNVPQNVRDEFHKLYKNVKDVKWEKVNEYHVARFNGPISKGADVDYTSAAWFTKEGKQCQAEQDMDFEELPVVVQERLALYMEVRYPGWTIDECEMVHRLDMGLIYVVEIEKGELEREISLSIYGDILKDVADDDDDDVDDILPVIVPEQLKVALQQLFADHFGSVTIVEVDVDDDEIEVDVLVGNCHQEITFNLNYKWISTEYEAAVKDFLEMLDQEFRETKERLIALAEEFKVNINDPLVQKHIKVEVEEHYLKGKSYTVEVKLGQLEVEVHIDKNGHFTVEEDD